MRVLIIGAERLGRALATDLLHAGHEVGVLDARQDLLGTLPGNLQGVARHGSPLDRDTLAGAVEGCDAAAAVSSDDCLNAVVALAARRELDVPLAVAMIGNPRRADALVGMGVHIVCPTTWAVRELHLTLVRSGVESELALGTGIGVFRAEVPARLGGRSLAELDRPGELIVVAVERDGHTLIAVPGLELAYGDVIHVAAAERDYVAELVRP